MLDGLGSAIYTKLQGTAISSQLKSGSAIYYQMAPDNAAYPYIVFSLSSGIDENWTPSRSINAVYTIRALSTESMKKADLIDAAIDSAFLGSSFSVSGWSNFWLARENHMTAIDAREDKKKVYQSISSYRIRLAK